jgi:predicted ATPase/class 3 adenylate cyclase
VLFADLSGFTSLGERLDPEDLRALQNDLHREMASVIKDFDGFLEKFVGDAVLACFGAPVAHEDDPARALGAALAMRAGIESLNGRWQERLGKALALHIGVETGPVVAGALGIAEEAAYAVTGDSVNTAARLQATAGDDEILVGPTIFRLTRNLYPFEPAGEIALKGKSDPVPAYRLIGKAARSGSGRGLAALGLTAPLVGRRRELELLLDAFDQALRGRPQVVRVMGEAGSGKTRLIEEFVSRLDREGRLEGIALRRAACVSIGDRTFGVLASLIRDGYAIEPTDSLEVARDKLETGLQAIGTDGGEAAEMVPYFAAVLGIEAGGEALDQIEPEQLKRQIFMAARSMFEHRLRTGPLLTVVEDLHWADAASVELLRFLVDRLDDRPFLLLLSHRPSFDVGTLATSRTSQAAIRLGPLSDDECEALISALFETSAGGVAHQLRQLIVERAGGNPFYLEEIVRGLVESGVLHRDDGGMWRSSGTVAMRDVPLTIQGLLLSRLDRLPPPVRRLTQEAAVLGVEFDRALLARISREPDQPDDQLDRGLEALRAAELIEDTGGGAFGDKDRRYRFTHSIVQEVVYQNLLLKSRTALHGRAGAELEAICGGMPERLEQIEALAYHFSASDDSAKGVGYMVAAGDRARRVFANDDAIRHYRRALETIETSGLDGPERLEVLERLADLLGPMGRRDEALGHYETVLGALVEADDRAAQARLYRKIAWLHWEDGARDLALARIKAGLDLLEGREQEIELAHLYHEMGRLAFRGGDNDGAVEWARRALLCAEPLLASANGNGADTAPAHEAAAVVSEAYNTLGVAQARRDQPTDAVAHVEKSLAVAEAHHLFQAACRGYTNLSVLYGTLDPGRAIETCQRGLAVAKKIGDLGFQSRLYANLGVSFCTFTGRCEGEGVDAVRTAIDLDRELGLVDHLPVSLVVLGQIYQCHGEPRVAIDLYQEALDLAEALDEPQILFPCYDGLATVHLDLDDPATAEQYMEKAQAVCVRAGLEPDSLVVLPFLC